jgi:hypothetical protein
MGNVQPGSGSRDQDRRLPYQSRPGELDTIARQQAERSAAELYAYAPPPALSQDLEQRPVYEWVLRRAAQTTRGIARVDLVRPRLPLLSEDGRLWRAGADEGRVGYPSIRGGRDAYSRMQRTDFGSVGGGGGFAGSETSRLGFGPARGARIKLMRCIDIGARGIDEGKRQQPGGDKPLSQPFGDGALSDGLASPGILGKVAGALQAQPAYRTWGALPRKDPWLSLGIGGSFELDSVSMIPAMRVRVQDWLTLKILPQPVLKLQKSLRLPNSALSLRLRYEVPLEAIEDPLRPPARLLVRLDNHVGSGVHLSPSGIDFDQRIVTLGQGTSVRFAGHAAFPRQLPVPEGKQLLNWDVDRLGLKTSW